VCAEVFLLSFRFCESVVLIRSIVQKLFFFSHTFFTFKDNERKSGKKRRFLDATFVNRLSHASNFNKIEENQGKYYVYFGFVDVILRSKQGGRVECWIWRRFGLELCFN